jgi:hypothetical protein
MGTVGVFAGIDYHDRMLQVCVLDEAGRVLCNCGCVNDAAALNALVRRHGDEVKAAMVGCCGASDLADALIVRFGSSVHLAHAGYVRRLKPNQDKTDFGDARLLAEGVGPVAVRVPPEAVDRVPVPVEGVTVVLTSFPPSLNGLCSTPSWLPTAVIVGRTSTISSF